MLYHPDKCSAPKTDEAFKAIGHSFAILSDSDKRRNYDMIGEDSTRNNNPRRNFNFNNNFEQEINPEDIFNMFFGDLSGQGIFKIKTKDFNMLILIIHLIFNPFNTDNNNIDVEDSHNNKNKITKDISLFIFYQFY